MIEVLVVPTEELGDRSYVVHDGEVAVVVDPQRDIDRLEAVLDEHGLGCAYVLETHVHNDYVSGGPVLAERRGARVVLSAADAVAYDHVAVSDGDRLTAGTLTVTVVETPGHTDGHLAYVVSDGGPVPAVLTGGSLLYGSVGRTDLVDVTRTEELARRQFRSAHRLADLLPGEAPVYPTHGFGSFCSAGAATGGDASTVALERTRNDALVTDDEDAFVAALVAGLTAYPAYYVHMGPRNREGAGPVDLSLPALVDGDELRQRIAAGEWVVDLRTRSAHAAGHLRGTIGVPLELSFATTVGWIVPLDAPITLLGASSEDVTAAQRQLVRIGIDRPAAAGVGDHRQWTAPDEQLASFRRASFADLTPASLGDGVVVDVRRVDERRDGALVGSLHVPLHDLPARLGDLPRRTLWVHCGAGYRATVAAGILQRAGFDVVVLDDDWANAGHSALIVAPPTVASLAR